MTAGPNRRTPWLAVLGPGILFASTAIGVSHLVQSTRAGAIAGFGLLWAVIAANVAKYPFFEFGSRYANATGHSLVEGYRSLGRPVAWAYFIIALGTCFFVMGAVGIVTASFLDNLFSISIATGFNATPAVSVAVFALATGMLTWGAYGGLDALIKVIAAVLLFSTAIAFWSAARHTSLADVPPAPVHFNPLEGADLAFLIALMGWMPTAVDLSTWNSIWTLERIKQTGYHPELRSTLREFNAGYIASGLLALMFLGLGALVLYTEGTDLPKGTAVFAASIVSIYTEAIGEWSRWIIGAAAFSAMLGTCIACLDGYSRALARSFRSIQSELKLELPALEKWVLVVVSAGSLLLILAFPSDIQTLVDMATTLSFVVAPAVAAANWHLVSQTRFPKSARPPLWLHTLAGIGMLFLVGFTLLFCIS
ncbi:MAG TPA: divalent metal cation transporter [Flavobacteriales bacterium]|nr:divalent metal cation transporter [Flavobacteriales bacterium]|tara:strand:- start:1241 stop:2509 length:1269 start_codon:yes stop_codon:yes gene_type:complete